MTYFGVCARSCACVSDVLNVVFVVFRLWFDELMGLWMAVQNQPSWEGVRRTLVALLHNGPILLKLRKGNL